VKPPPFVYHAPTGLDEALAVLAEVGDDGKVLAGGQSLIPLLNMRLAAPGHLVDVGGVAGLDRLEVADGAVRVGATVRHRALERHAGASDANPLLGQALRHVAHPVIRNRGTTVGSIAHADPAGEMPAVLAVLGGHAELTSVRGTRRVAADEFFLGPLQADVAPDELVTAVVFPDPGPRSGTAFEELARRHGDYALAGVAVVVTLDDDQRVDAARAAFIGVGGVPVVVDLADACGGQSADTGRGQSADTGRGQSADAVGFGGAVAAAHAAVDPDDDIHATADYRRHLAGVLLDRALQAAVRRAATTVDGGART
jgi:carbon-monoxide dehydrogenase medium subunit